MKKRIKAHASGNVRIIGGEWRGRRLPVSDQAGLRPSGDRTRETLFNWLQPYLVGSRCLDLFAGSGALGMEAASRGAACVELVEKNPLIVRQLQANVHLLGAGERVLVRQANAQCWLKQNEPGTRIFDIVFIDPPWESELQLPILDLLLNGGWLARRALIYAEYPNKLDLAWPSGLSQLRGKRFGLALGALLQLDC